ncbi:MAG: GAF domain-containing protein [Desulfarculaceae bacterium]|jgi:signal transduction protein with GAF and PtsI domain
MRKKKREINYQTLEKICDIIASAKDLTKASHAIVSSLTETLNLKGCALMLINRRSKKLELAAAHGLSKTYLNKGPLSMTKSIAESLQEGPVAIYNVAEDPRLQYPQEALKEGIGSILSVPVVLRGKALGVLRLYSAEPWEYTMQDLTFVQAVAEIIALVLDNLRLTKAYKTSIELLKVLRPMVKTARPSL